MLYDIKCVRIQKRKGTPDRGKKMLFIFNPKAGKGKIKTNLLDIVDIFSGHDYEIIIRATQAPKDAYQKAKGMQTLAVDRDAVEETVLLMKWLPESWEWEVRYRSGIFPPAVRMILRTVCLCRKTWSKPPR